MIIECKGETRGSSQNQVKHSAFPNLLGQIVSRMNREGNNPKKARIYAIGIPEKWVNTFKNKIIEMRYAWKVLKLKAFLVKKNGEVDEKPYSWFLKN